MATKPTNLFLGIETSNIGEVSQFTEGATIPTNWYEVNRPYYNPTKAQLQASNYIDFEPAKAVGKEIAKSGSVITTKNISSNTWNGKEPVFVNGYYFVGISGGMAISTDMDSWEYINLLEQLPPSRRNTGFSGEAVAGVFSYDNVRNLFVCMCESAMFVSVDAKNWVVRKQFGNLTMYNYFRLNANTAVITTGNANGFLYRTDNNWGTWTTFANAPNVNHARTVLYGSTLVAYGGASNYISTDGQNWTTFSFPWSTSNINSFQYLVHAGRLYVVIIYNSNNLTSIYSTTDFVSWTTHTTTLSLSVNSRKIASYSGKLWAIDSSIMPRRILSSTDGSTWSAVTIENFDDFASNNMLSQLGPSNSESIYNVNDRLVLLGGSTNKINGKPISFFYTSMDGKRWKGCTTPSDSFGNNVLNVYSPALGYDLGFSTSNMYIVKEGSTSYALSGTTSFLSSTDNFVNDITYVGNPNLSPAQPRQLIKRNNTFIGFGNNGTVVYSLDAGVTWTKVTQTGITSGFITTQKTSFDTYVVISTSSASRYFITVSFSGDVPTITKSTNTLPAGVDANYSYSPQLFVEYPVGTYVVLGRKTLTTNSDVFSWFKWTSTDQGATWTIDETAILFDGLNPGSVSAVFTYSGKVFATTTFGIMQTTDMVTWTPVSKVPKLYVSSRPIFLSDRVVVNVGVYSFWTKDGTNWYCFDFFNLVSDPSVPSQLLTATTLQSTTSDSDYIYYYLSGGTVVRYSKTDTTGFTATLLNKVSYQPITAPTVRGVQIGESMYIMSSSTLFVSSDRMRTWKRLASFGGTSYIVATDEKYLYVMPTLAGNGSVTHLYKVCPSSGAYECISIPHPYLSNNTITYGYGKNSNGCATNGSGTLVVGLNSSSNFTGTLLTITGYGQNYQVITLPGSATNHVAWHVTYFEGTFYTGNAGALSSTDYWKSSDGITWTKETRFDAFYPIYFYRCFSKLFALCYRDGQYRVYEVPNINDLSTWVYKQNLGARCFSPQYYGADANDAESVGYSIFTAMSMYPLGEFNGVFYAVLGPGLICKSTDGFIFELIDHAWGGNNTLFLENRIVSLGGTASRTDTIEVVFKKITTPNQYVVSNEPTNSTQYVYKP